MSFWARIAGLGSCHSPHPRFSTFPSLLTPGQAEESGLSFPPRTPDGSGGQARRATQVSVRLSGACSPLPSWSPMPRPVQRPRVSTRGGCGVDSEAGEAQESSRRGPVWGCLPQVKASQSLQGFLWLNHYPRPPTIFSLKLEVPQPQILRSRSLGVGLGILSCGDRVFIFRAFEINVPQSGFSKQLKSFRFSRCGRDSSGLLKKFCFKNYDTMHLAPFPFSVHFSKC